MVALVLACASLLATLFSTGCSDVPVTEAQRYDDLHGMLAEIRSASEEWRRSNPCGAVRIRRPLAEVSGRVGEGAAPSVSVSLLAVRNVSFEASRYAAANCAVLAESVVGEDGGFRLGALPEGDLLIVFSGDGGGSQSMPVGTLAVNDSRFLLEQGWSGPVGAAQAVSIALRLRSADESRQAEVE